MKLHYLTGLVFCGLLALPFAAQAQDISAYPKCINAPKTQNFSTTKPLCETAVKVSNGVRIEAVKASNIGLDGDKLVAASKANQVTGALLMILAKGQFKIDNTYSDEVCEYTYQAKDLFGLVVVTPKETEPMHLYYKDANTYFLGCAMVAFPKAQQFLKTGNRSAIAELMKPLAYLGNDPAKNTLSQMGVKYYGPAPSDNIPNPPAPSKSLQTEKIDAEKAYQSCSQVPSEAAVPAAMQSCEEAHAKLSNLAAEATGTDVDLYIYSSGVAAFQHARLYKKQNPRDIAGICKLLQAANRQFSRMTAKAQQGTEHFKIAAATQNTLSQCKSKGF